MIPVGYLYKKVATRPEWLDVAKVDDIFSASCCISKGFADYINFWKHNGYWLFDSPGIMESLASGQKIELGDQTLFYYEAFDSQFDQESRLWTKFDPVAAFKTDVLVPRDKRLHGFDVSTFLCGNKPECSPLSCNYLAKELTVNSHCLFETFVAAKEAVDCGAFDDSEPGPLRILAVYTIGGK